MFTGRPQFQAASRMGARPFQRTSFLPKPLIPAARRSLIGIRGLWIVRRPLQPQTPYRRPRGRRHLRYHYGHQMLTSGINNSMYTTVLPNWHSCVTSSRTSQLLRSGILLSYLVWLHRYCVCIWSNALRTQCQLLPAYTAVLSTFDIKGKIFILVIGGIWIPNHLKVYDPFARWTLNLGHRQHAYFSFLTLILNTLKCINKCSRPLRSVRTVDLDRTLAGFAK